MEKGYDKIMVSEVETVSLLKHHTFPGNCPPTPPLGQHFSESEQ